MPENIPFVPFLRWYGWVGDAAQQLSPSAVVIASQTQETGAALGWRALVAAAFTAWGEEIARREKSALVPISEYLPLVFDLTAKAAGFSREVVYFLEHFRHTPAPKAEPLAVVISNIGVVLCSEAFALWFVRDANAGARWVAILLRRAGFAVRRYTHGSMSAPYIPAHPRLVSRSR